MRTTIFVPQKINVGFQNRSDTYTKKLAYVIYYDEKGVLRKEKSWNSWRDKKIPNIEFDNVPTSGFVLNKKAGGYSTGWNHRQTYVRVYDPRDFEFEISIPNLLYILENATSTKGKGLEGQFVYGWDGTELALIPVDSPDYKEISELNALRHECKKYEGKDLILGATYRDNCNSELVYVGRFYEANSDNKESKAYFFYNLKQDNFTTIKTLNKNIIGIIDDKCIENYAELMDKLKAYNYYSERDPKKDVYVDYTFAEFNPKLNKEYYWGVEFFSNEVEDKQQKIIVQPSRRNSGYYSFSDNKRKIYHDVYTTSRGYADDLLLSETTPEKIFEKYKPKYLVSYKSNGELIKEWK